MSTTSDLVRMIADAREAAGTLCRDFDQEVKPWDDLIRAVAAGHGMGYLDAVVTLCKDLDKAGKRDGYAQMMLLAAAYEEAQRSEG